MVTSVNILASCTERKHRPVPDRLQLRSVAAADTVEARASAWLERLESVEADNLPATEMYAGDHWTVVRNLSPTAERSGLNTMLWVCSAGYGLIRATARIKPYSATFSSGQPDSVSRGLSPELKKGAEARWWGCLGSRPDSPPGVPKTVREIALAEPTNPIIVVASEAYVRAMQKDLLGARQSLADPGLLIIISAGAKQLDELHENLLPIDARMQKVVGGSLTSLNARVARKVLSEVQGNDINNLTLRSLYADIMQSIPVAVAPRRKALSDDEVCDLISGILQKDNKLSASRALRELRDSGFACEQARFGELFQKIKARRDA